VSNPPRLRDFPGFQRPRLCPSRQPTGRRGQLRRSGAGARLSRPESAARAAPRGRLEVVQGVLTDTAATQRHHRHGGDTAAQLRGIACGRVRALSARSALGCMWDSGVPRGYAHFWGARGYPRRRGRLSNMGLPRRDPIGCLTENRSADNARYPPFWAVAVVGRPSS
jgi:hypothetical protein